MDAKIEIHDRCIEARKRSIQNWHVPDGVKNEVYDFLNDLELGKVNRGRKILN